MSSDTPSVSAPSDSLPPPPPSTAQVSTDAFSLFNSVLMVLIGYLLWKLFGARLSKKEEEKEEPLILPEPLPKHDMTLDELCNYDGKGPDKRICIAILGRVYDCTKSYHFYGPEGTYRNFAGRDATRALAQFDVMAVKTEWDDCSDLTASEMSSVQEWKEQFEERYHYVGRLVRSAEEIIETVEDDPSTGAVGVGAGGDDVKTQSSSASSVAASTGEASDLEIINSDQSEMAEPLK